MIYWVVAMPCEARAIIDELELKRRNLPCRFEIYESPADKTPASALVVSGIGSRNAEVATAFLAGLYSPIQKEDLLINIGICGTCDAEVSTGQAFQCVRLSEDARTGDHREKSIYPKWRRELNFQAAGLKTAEHIVREEVLAAGKQALQHSLYDMEGYHVLHTAEIFFMPDQMLCIKVVSDHLKDALQITPEKVTELMRPTVGILKEYVRKNQTVEAKTEDHTIQRDGRINFAVDYYKASVGMTAEIRALDCYVELLCEKDSKKAEDWWRLQWAGC